MGRFAKVAGMSLLCSNAIVGEARRDDCAKTAHHKRMETLSPCQRFTIVMTLLLSSVGALADADAPTTASFLNDYRHPAPGTYAGGQPSAGDIRALAAAGPGHIINLRPAAEPGGFDEAAVAAAAGLGYHNLPIAGGGDINFANAAKLDALLAETDGETRLLHCASGNRVGALMALRASMAGLDDEAAIIEGRRWGLTGLESVVRQRLSDARSAGQGAPAVPTQ